MAHEKYVFWTPKGWSIFDLRLQNHMPSHDWTVISYLLSFSKKTCCTCCCYIFFKDMFGGPLDLLMFKDAKKDLLSGNLT